MRLDIQKLPFITKAFHKVDKSNIILIFDYFRYTIKKTFPLNVMN